MITACLLAAALLDPAPLAPLPPDHVAAVVNGRPITIAELDQRAGARLETIRVQEHSIRKQVLEDLIGTILLEAEAAKRGVPTEEVLRIEVTEKVRATPLGEAKDIQAQGASSVAPAAPAPNDLAMQTAKRKRAFLRSLRRGATVDVRIEGPRVTVSADDDPAQGPADAAVTLVQFSDYQCPYCRSVQTTMAALRERFGGKVRVVYRDFPLGSATPAATAAEAAGCAREQGKFWEMHEKLFQNQKTLEGADYGAFAAELGMERSRFEQCLSSRRHQAEWRRDVEQGKSYGVTGTPMTFVNGRPVAGAQSLELFATVVEEELQRAGVD